MPKMGIPAEGISELTSEAAISSVLLGSLLGKKITNSLEGKETGLKIRTKNRSVKLLSVQHKFFWMSGLAVRSVPQRTKVIGKSNKVLFRSNICIGNPKRLIGSLSICQVDRSFQVEKIKDNLTKISLLI